MAEKVSSLSLYAVCSIGDLIEALPSATGKQTQSSCHDKSVNIYCFPKAFYALLLVKKLWRPKLDMSCFTSSPPVSEVLTRKFTMCWSRDNNNFAGMFAKVLFIRIKDGFEYLSSKLVPDGWTQPILKAVLTQPLASSSTKSQLSTQAWLCFS